MELTITVRPRHVNYPCKCKLAEKKHVRCKQIKMDDVQNGEMSASLEFSIVRVPYYFFTVTKHIKYYDYIFLKLLNGVTCNLSISLYIA